jgi:CheY-like chemotaxis protein
MSVEAALERLGRSGSLPYGTPAIVCSVPEMCEITDALGVSEYLVKPVSREQLAAALDRVHLSGNTILIVDDEPEALRLFRRMLTSLGRDYRVLRARDGEEAMTILQRTRPDVILLDLVMPNMDGFRLLAAKNQDPALRDIPVIVISARDPAGQPIVSNALAVMRGGGLSVPRLLACIEALTAILSTAGPIGDPGLKAVPADGPVYE